MCMNGIYLFFRKGIFYDFVFQCKVKTEKAKAERSVLFIFSIPIFLFLGESKKYYLVFLQDICRNSLLRSKSNYFVAIFCLYRAM